MPESQGTLRVCILTPIGRGAIATIAVAGRDAHVAVSRFFRPALPGQDPKTISSKFQVDTVRFGVWQSDDSTDGGETVVVCPVSDEEVEVHCHGGRAIVQSIVDDLTSLSAVQQDSFEWLSEREEYLTAECQMVLTGAQTARTSSIALSQCRGALQREVHQIDQLLQQGFSHQARQRIDALAERYVVGQRVSGPISIVIAGPPNVGKSSLMNAMLGFQRAITFDQPGTTRDVLSAATSIDGWMVQLSDTAGIHPSDDAIERQGVQRARQTIDDAELVLMVVDSSVGWTQQHDQIWQSIDHAESSVVVVWNKVDLVDSCSREPTGIETSTVSGSGIQTLMESIARRLNVPWLAECEDLDQCAIPITRRQYDCLQRARQADNLEQMSRAMETLLHGR